MTVESIEASIASEWARRRGAARKDDAKLRVMFVPTIISAAREGRGAAERNYILHCLSVRKRMFIFANCPKTHAIALAYFSLTPLLPSPWLIVGSEVFLLLGDCKRTVAKRDHTL